MRWFAAILALGLGLSSTARATPINLVHVITLGGSTYTGDQWTLDLTGAITATVTYTVTDADVLGCNICNTTAHWGAAINADPIVGDFLTATYIDWDGIGPVPPSEITLTRDHAGKPFSASVSVFEACDCDFDESEPLTVSIVTKRIGVPEPSTLAIFGVGLLGLARARAKYRGRGF